MKKIIRLLPVAYLALLIGCSSLGSDKFQCPAQTGGSTCMSARQVYSATHVADRVAPNYKDGKPIEPSSSGTPAQAAAAEARPASQSAAPEYRPPLPEVDAPLPVRVPAKIMRVRIFPWEDSLRDLNAGSFVFTEIEGRTWTLGEEQVARVQGNVVQPLAAPRSAAVNQGPSTFVTPLSSPSSVRSVAPSPPQSAPSVRPQQR